MLETIVFYILAAGLLTMGLVVITRTNPIAAALSLVAAFGALAGLYALLSAPLVAVVQVLVYAGGIMVIIIFVIMLLNLHEDDLKPLKAKAFWVLVALLAAFSVALGPVLLGVLPPGLWKQAQLPEGFGGIVSVGQKIFLEHIFPFEMLSLLLMAAIVGALVLAKRKL